MLEIALTMLAIAFGGFFVAAFGAWKDTLWEKFSLKKFFRTPIITIAMGILLVVLLGSPSDFLEGIGYALSAVTLERLAVDCIYKAIRRKMPSKFLRPQRDTGWLRERLSHLFEKTDVSS